MKLEFRGKGVPSATYRLVRSIAIQEALVLI